MPDHVCPARVLAPRPPDERIGGGTGFGCALLLSGAVLLVGLGVGHVVAG